MDCRKSLVVVVGLFAGSFGCTILPQTPTAPAPSAESTAENSAPKRQPKPATCVALAVLRESEAEEPQRSQADRDKAHEEARIEYQQALAIEPNYGPALVGLARYHDKAKEHDKAVAMYEKALQAQPKDAALWYELGMCYARAKEWQPSIRSLRKAAELEPDNQQTVSTLGFTLARAGQYEESYEFFRQHVGEARAHCNLALVLHHLQQDELSRQQAQLALQADPQMEIARKLLNELTPVGGVR